MIKDAPFEELNSGAQLRRVSRAVLFADVVDSVRLVDTDEEDTVRRWVSFADEAARQIDAMEDGQLVKRMGDGLLAEFETVQSAVVAALGLRQAVTKMNRKVPDSRRIELRMSVVAGELLKTEDNDVYGHLVNIAQRLAGAARPGQILTSASVRDQIASDPQVELQDLGLLHLKNVSQPVQTYLLQRHDEVPVIAPRISIKDLLPTIAALPIVARNNDDMAAMWTNLLTDDLVSALARSKDLNVVSRLSTMGFTLDHRDMSDIRSSIGADYLITGHCWEHQGKTVLELEMAETLTGIVIWTSHVEFNSIDFLQRNDIFSGIANEVHGALLKRQMERALSDPLPSLEGYAVLFGANALMNRLSKHDFDYAGRMLEAVIERYPHAPVPLAAKARWHVLKVQQGWTEDRMAEGLHALEYTRRALNIDPQNTDALIVAGNVNNNLLHDLDEAEDLFDNALEITPNDALGRALRAVLFTFRGEGLAAVSDAERALQIAPLDPQRYFLQSMAAGASLVNADNERALQLATSSLRLNGAHTSTLRVKAVAEMRLGRGEAAHATLAKLLEKQPDFSIGWWKRNTPAAMYQLGKDFIETLRDMGVPE